MAASDSNSSFPIFTVVLAVILRTVVACWCLHNTQLENHHHIIVHTEWRVCCSSVVHSFLSVFVLLKSRCWLNGASVAELCPSTGTGDLWTSGEPM